MAQTLRMTFTMSSPHAPCLSTRAPHRRSPLLLACLASLAACGPYDRAEPAGADAAPPADVTYSNQIVRLLQQHCQSCHRPDGLGPFPLLSYQDTSPHATNIVDAVMSHRMPEGMPVRLGTGCSEPETFLGSRRLTQEEIETFAAWASEGAPEGDPADLPPPLQFPDGEWLMGAPDVDMPNNEAGFAVPGTITRDIFRRFVIPTDFGADKFITGFEAIPGTPGGAGLSHIVHHVTLFVGPRDEALAREAAFALDNPEVHGPGFEGDFGFPTTLVGMWFPGSQPLSLKSGLGIRIPEGAALIAEVHYSPSQETIVDKTRIGLLLADEVIEELTVGLVKNEEFTVPANDSEFEVEARKVFDAPVTLYSITPHMHQLGTDFKVVIERPSGDTCLADVEWDFEHQGTYWLREPLELPAGSSIHTTCRYDNTTVNPNQFNFPPQDIVFGKVADREMCQLTAGLLPGSAPPPPPPPAAAPRLAEVFYDAVGDDATAEWVKFENPGSVEIDLSQYSLGWGGTNYSYGRLQLSGTIPAGGCLVVGAQSDGVAGVAADFVPDLQNSGSVADGVALFSGPAADISASSIPIDSVVYGSTNSNSLPDATGAPSAVDVGSAPAGSSIRRSGDTWSAGLPQPGLCP